MLIAENICASSIALIDDCSNVPVKLFKICQLLISLFFQVVTAVF